MRRTTLKAIASGAFAVAALPSLAAPARRIDRRLLGVWRSDKERTTRLWRFRNELDAAKKQWFESLFGKLTLRYTPTRLHSEFDGEKTSRRYRIVASDAWSVVLAYDGEPENQLSQIFFEDEWIYTLSGYNIEFFRRVER